MRNSIASILIALLINSTGCISTRPMILEQKDVGRSDDINILYLKDSTVVEFPAKSGRYDSQNRRYFSTIEDSISVPAESVYQASVDRDEFTVAGVMITIGIAALLALTLFSSGSDN